MISGSFCRCVYRMCNDECPFDLPIHRTKSVSHCVCRVNFSVKSTWWWILSEWVAVGYWRGRRRKIETLGQHSQDCASDSLCCLRCSMCIFPVPSLSAFFFFFSLASLAKYAQFALSFLASFSGTRRLYRYCPGVERKSEHLKWDDVGELYKTIKKTLIVRQAH